MIKYYNHRKLNQNDIEETYKKIRSEQMNIAPIKRRMVTKGQVIIKDHVWIGDKATILSGVRMGRGVIVAANAVVTRDVQKVCVAAGVQAKVVKNMLHIKL